MDVTRLTLGERVVLAAGVVLIIDLLFLPWHDVDVGGIAIAGLDTTYSGVQSPNGGYGVIALILTLVMVGQIIAAKLTSASLPNPPVPWSQVHLIAGALVLILLAIKLIVETDSLGFGAYLGLLLAAGIAYGAYMIKQEAGRLVA